VAAALLVLAVATRAQSSTIGATIGGERFALEVARDAATMYRGLGGRARIDPHGGMLFVYPVAEPLAFVMRDCPVPIDVAFLDAVGRVINQHEMKPEPARKTGESEAAYEARLPLYRSALPARFAVELAGGRLRALGIGPGDRVEIDWQTLGAP
jgi:uncharacterized membrane protein (UPF0127 family)